MCNQVKIIDVKFLEILNKFEDDARELTKTYSNLMKKTADEDTRKMIIKRTGAIDNMRGIGRKFIDGMEY